MEKFCASAQSFAEKVCRSNKTRIEATLWNKFRDKLDEEMKKELLDSCQVDDLFVGLASSHHRE